MGVGRMEDIDTRVAKIMAAFRRLNQVWNANKTSKSTKIGFFRIIKMRWQDKVKMVALLDYCFCRTPSCHGTAKKMAVH